MELGERAEAERLNDLAMGELANGHPAAAVRALKQALALNPRLARAHFNLGTALRDLDRVAEAMAAFRAALQIDSADTAAHHRLGELLFEQGHFDQARGEFESALSLDPNLNESRVGMGDALAELGEWQRAANCYRDAIARGPMATGGVGSATAGYTKLGHVLWKLGDSAGALAAFARAVAVSPDSAEAHYNLGSAQLEAGRYTEAIGSAREALRLRRGLTEAVTLYAAGLAALGDSEAGAELLRKSASEGTALAQHYLTIAVRLLSSRLFAPARQCLEGVLRESPDDAMARHLLAALSGDNPDHPVDGYVRKLFDASAATFDRELVSKLGYNVPGEMAAALRAVQAAPGKPWSVLDLGCGTGLVGVAIADCARYLTGVDLAPNMIERAAARKLYTHLHCMDLQAALAREAAQQTHYDVVTVADVFIYVGKLDDVIPAIRRVLRPGGLFAASVEAVEAAEGMDSEEYRLGAMGRYAHSRDYLRRLAQEHGFEVALLRETRIRLEHRRPVGGWLTVWRAT